MGYVEQNLLQGEEVVYRARLHLVIFLAPALLALLGILAFVVSAELAALLLVIALLLAVDRYIRLTTSEFAVTNKRVLIKIGLVRRHTLELLLAKVETIGVEQEIFGRIFNYGTIVVTGTGGTKELFAGIAKPLEFRKAVQERALF
ncbi:MAG TPA: PH domain-containing protein [Geobacteraceae bacterium]